MYAMAVYIKIVLFENIQLGYFPVIGFILF